MSHSRMPSIDYTSLPLLFPEDSRNYAVEEWLRELEAVTFGTAEMDVSVDSIIQMKLNRHQEHEKTLIKLKVVPTDHSKPTFNTYITTERGANLEDDDCGSLSSLSPLDKEKDCAFCALNQLISSDLDAIDRVSLPPCTARPTFEEYIEKRRHNYTILSRITINRSMSLSQLAVLLVTIHRISIKYDPIRYNCYWYAYTLGEVILREFGGLVSSDTYMDKRGKWGDLNLRKVDSVEEVITNFRVAWTEMEVRLATQQSTRQGAITENVQLQQQLATERTEREQAEREREQAEREREQAEREREQAEREREQAEREREQAERELQQQLEAERAERERVERQRDMAMLELSRLQALLSQRSDPSLP